MPETSLGRDSLVLYKGHPAIVTRTGDKLEILLEDGKTLKVRPKDVVVLHRGPADFRQLQPQAGDMLGAWELLAGGSTTLAELVELAFSADTPATAWAAWKWVTEGLYFSGEPNAVLAHTAEEVALRRAVREAKAAEAQAWTAFLGRVQQKQFVQEDLRYLQEVEELALGKRERSRVLSDLGRGQTPENAHALLLEVGYWDEYVDPYPIRMNAPQLSPAISLGRLGDEQRVDLTDLPAFAIDDEGSSDPDDALSLDGNRLWVHVADAAALVPADSPADLEARQRGANLYLPEGTVTMLPREATEQLALGLAEVSPALSFGLDLDGPGQVIGVEIVPSWVRVTRLTYEDVETRLDQEPFATLLAIANAFEARRRNAGAISLDLPEVKIYVEDGQVHIRPLVSLRSRSLVSEAMLAVGEVLARFAVERNIPMPFTVQDQSDALRLPTSLSEMVGCRRMLKASQQSTVPRPHAGLGLSCYIRTTSPLRRYLDLVTHQQLRAFLAGRSVLTESAILERVGMSEAVTGSIRRTEQLARQHWTLVYLMHHRSWRGQGILVDKAGARGTVLIPSLAWEARVHLRDDLPLDSVLTLALQDVNLPNLDAHFRVL